MKLHSAAVVLIAAIVASGCVQPSTQVPEVSSQDEQDEIKKQNELALDSIINQQQRLVNVSWPVAAKGSSICGEDRRLSTGYLVVEAEYFPEHLREAIRQRYGLDKKPEKKGFFSAFAGEPVAPAEDEDIDPADEDASLAVDERIPDADPQEPMADAVVQELAAPNRFVIISVAELSPADQAGMQAGDVIVSLNGEIFSGRNELVGEGKENQFTIRRAGERMELSLVAEQVCKYPIALVFDNQVNAFADGENVIITSGLMRALTDTQVQVVVAHELAHNLRKHIDAQKTNAAIGTIIDLAVIIGTGGINPGMRSLAVMQYSEDFEAEADYVAMYILAEAGFDLEEVPDIWRRMTMLNPAIDQSKSSIFGRSHPTNAQRFLAMEQAIEEIRAKQAAGEELLPNLKPE